MIIGDLISISKDLLNYVNQSATLAEDERDYIISVVRKVMFILLVELRNKPYVDVLEI